MSKSKVFFKKLRAKEAKKEKKKKREKGKK